MENGEEVSLDGLPAGAYRIHVAQKSGSGYYSLTLNLPGAIVDSDEPNGTRQTATNLHRLMGSGGLNQRNLHRQTDEDWFRFETVAVGGPADQLELKNRTDIAVTGLVFELYDASGTRLGVSSANATGRVISMSQRVAGVYYMRVAGATVQTGIPYDLAWRLPTPATDVYEPSDALGAANDLGLLTSARQINGLSIHQRNESDWFRFFLPEGANANHQIIARFVHDDGDLDLELLNAQGKTIRFAHSHDDDEVLSLNGLAGGEYYLRVHGFESALSPSYRLEFTPPSISPDAREPNNSRVTAFALPATQPGTLLLNTLHSSTDEDWYQFALSANGRSGDEVRIGYTQAYGDVQAELYNAQGNLIQRAVTTRDFETLSLAGLLVGTYSVRVFGTNNALSPRYDLSWQFARGADAFEPNESRNTATALGNLSGQVTTANVNLHQTQDEDWFSFGLPLATGEGDRIELVSNQSAAVVLLELWSPAGTLLAASSDRTLSLSGLAAANYFLRVRTGGGELADYQLQWNLPTQGADASEPNNLATLATPLGLIRVPLLLDGLQLGANDQDWFQFETEALGRIRDRIQLMTTSIGTFDFELWQNGQLIRGASTEETSKSLLLDGLPEGIYQIRVTTSDKGGGYQLSFTPPEPPGGWDALEPNNALASATSLGSIVGGFRRDRLTIHQTTDEDWFRFSLLNNATIGHQIKVELESNQSTVIAELRSEGGSLLRSAIGAGPTLLISLDGLSAGTYQLKVAAQGTLVPVDYSLEIEAPETRTALDSFEPNESFATARQLPLATGKIDLTQLSLHPSDTADWFAFSLTQTSRPTNHVQLSAETRSGIKLRLTNANGQTIQEAALYQPGSVELSLANLIAGDYRIGVLPFAGVADPRGIPYRLTVELGDSAVARDRFEPNDTLATSTPLTLSTRSPRLDQLTLHDANDADVFTFRVVNGGIGQSLSVVADRQDAQFLVELYDETLQKVRSSSSAGNVQKVLLNGLSEANYRILIRSLDNVISSYSLMFHGAHLFEAQDALEPNDTPGEAYSLQRLSDRIIAPSLEVTDQDEDWYRIQLPSNGTFNDRVVARYAMLGPVPQMRLYRATDQQLVLEATTYSGLSELNLAGLLAADYFIRITSPHPVVYALETHATPATNGSTDPAEPNASKTAAAGIGTFDQPRILGPFLSIAADEDWFSLSTTVIGTASDQLALLYDRRLGGIKAELQDSSGIVIAQSTDANTSGTDGIIRFTLENRPASQYFLKVENVNGVVPYHLVMLPPAMAQVRNGADGAEPNQEPNSATVLSDVVPDHMGVSIETITSSTEFQKRYEALRPEGVAQSSPWGDLKTRWDQRTDSSFASSVIQAGNAGIVVLPSLQLDPADQDWFMFETGARGATTHGIFTEFERSGTSAKLTLFAVNDLVNPIRQQIVSGNQAKLSLEQLPVGRYLLRIDGATLPTKYRLELNAPTIAILDHDALELNDSASDPQDLGSMVSDREYQGLTLTSANDDVYLFQLVRPAVTGDEVFVTTAGASDDIDLELYRTDGTLVSAVRHREATSAIALAGLAAGTYRIRAVAPSSSDPLAYTLGFQIAAALAPDRFESPRNNNSEVDATDLGAVIKDRTIDGLSLTPGDLDHYRFLLSSPGNASSRILMETLSGSGLIGELLNDAGEVLRTGSQAPLSSLSLEGLAAGSYRLRIRSNAGETGAYQLTFQPSSTRTAWTFMVYLNAGANEVAAREELNRWEQLAAAAGTDVRFAVWLDQNSASVTENGTTRLAQPFVTPVKNNTPTVWTDVGRGFVAPDVADSIATSFERLGEKNSGSAASVVEFVNYAVANAPADHYALYVWGAGDALSGSLTDFDPVTGATTSDALQSSELAAALQTLKTSTLAGRASPIDLLILDSDGQGTVESLLEFGSRANVIVASPAEIPGVGFDIQRAWERWLAEPANTTANDFAHALVESVNVNAGLAAAVSGAQISALQTALKNFVTKYAAGDAVVMNALRQARAAAAISDAQVIVRDLGTMANLLSNNTALSADLRDAASGLFAAINSATLGDATPRTRSGIGIQLSNLQEPSNYANVFPVAHQANVTALLSAYVRQLDATQTVIAADGSEGDAVQSSAIELGFIQGLVTLPSRTLTTSDVDWFGFEIEQTLQAGDLLRLRHLTTEGILQAQVVDAYGNEVARGSGSSAVAFDVSLAGLVPGNYAIQITATQALRYALGWEIRANARTLPADNPTIEKSRDLTTHQTLLLAAEQVRQGESRFYTLDGTRQSRVRTSIEIVPHGGEITASWIDTNGVVIATQSGATPFRMQLPTGPVGRLKVSLATGTATTGAFSLQRIVADELAPKLIPISELSQETGSPFQFILQAIDEGEAPVRFALGANAPLGVMIQAETGIVSWSTNEVQSVTIPVMALDDAGNQSVFDYPLKIFSAWQNQSNSFDVDNNGSIQAIDALFVINELNSRQSSEAASGKLFLPAPSDRLYFDTDGDGKLFPLDVLLIINHLNRGSGEALNDGLIPPWAVDQLFSEQEEEEERPFD